MYCLFCVVLCIVCVYMCTELLPPGGYQIAVKYIIYQCATCDGTQQKDTNMWRDRSVGKQETVRWLRWPR